LRPDRTPLDARSGIIPGLSWAPMGNLLARLQSALGDAYRIERELGGGGMSRVFLAQETALKRPVVIKVLPPEMAAGVNVERFRREVELAASLQHPHIVPLLSAAASGDLLYYTMPLVEGESLRAKLGRHAAGNSRRPGDTDAPAGDGAAPGGARRLERARDALPREAPGGPIPVGGSCSGSARADGDALRRDHTHGERTVRHRRRGGGRA